MKQDVLSSPRLRELQKRKNRIFWRKVFLIVFCFIAFMAFLSYISRNPKVNINTLEISGNKIIETEKIKYAVDAKLSGYYLKLFPKTNFLLYPKEGITNELSNRFKRLKDISLELKDINTLVVSVSERTASYTWCGTKPPESKEEEQKCYFLDESGFVFDEAPYFSGDVYLRFYGVDGLNIDNLFGSNFSPQIFNNLVSFKNQILLMGLKPKAFYAGGDGDIKMILPGGAGATQNPEIIFKISADYNKVAENLQAALNTEPLKSNFKNKYNTLQYIDLRFGNKVYFKF